MITPKHLPEFTSQGTFKQYILEHNDGNLDKFLSKVNVSINHLLSSNLKQAGQLVGKIKRVKRFIPKKNHPQLLAFEARYLHWSGNHSQAEKIYRQAVTLARKQHNWDAAARIGQGLADVLMYVGKYDDARETGKKSLRYYRHKKMRVLEGKMLTNLGNIYHRMDRNYIALDYYNKARQIFAENGGAPLATLEYNRANIYTNINRYDRAATLYQTAAQCYHQAGYRLLETKARYSLGYLQFLTGRYSQALNTLELVQDIFTDLDDNQASAITTLDLAEINLHLNQYNTAIVQAENIIPIFRKLGMRYEQARACYFAARGYFKLGDYHLASRRLAQARELYAKEANNVWLGMVQIAFCEVYLAKKRYKQAHKAAVEARRLFGRSGDGRRIIDAEISMVETQLHTSREQSALKLAKHLLRKKLASYQTYSLLQILGQYFYRCREYKKALSHFKKAVTAIDKMMMEMYRDEIRFFFTQSKFTTYWAIVDCLLKLNKVNNAFHYYLKVMAVMNQQYDKILHHRKVSSELLEKRDNLRAGLKNLYRLSVTGEIDKHSRKEYLKTEHQLWNVEQKIRSYVRSTRKDTDNRQFIPEKFSRFLNSNETLISLAMSEKTIVAFYTDKHRTGYITLELSPDDLSLLVRELHFIMEQSVLSSIVKESTSKAVHYYLRKLYDGLIRPLQPHIKTDRLILLVDGQVAQVPFAALVSEDNIRLKDQYLLSITVNPADLMKRQRKIPNLSQSKNSIITVTSNDRSGIYKEGCRIKHVFNNAALYTDTDADINRLKTSLRDNKGFVHIATHAAHSSENPLFSRLLMADGPFFPFDLFGVGIETCLVTLSGCQTAASGMSYGGSFSLAKAFYQAGSRFVLASLWQISDYISIGFMEKFYTELKQHKYILTAYTNTLNNIAFQNSNPAFWSPFVLLGV